MLVEDKMDRRTFECLVAIYEQMGTNDLDDGVSEACVRKGWVSDGKLTSKAIEALEPYKVKNAIIMAAGFSSRFAPLSYECPKGLVEINGEVLIERQIKQLKSAGIDDIVVVVGYRGNDFKYLVDKFNVEIVENLEYSTRNNHSTLMAVKERLSNTYICSVDNYFKENPFRSYEWKSFYSVQWSEGETREWCLSCDKDNRIKAVKVGGCHSYYMIGPAYFDSDFSREFCKILSVEYPKEETKDKLWESIYIDYIDILDMEAKCYPDGSILEFDSIEDANKFDPEFLDKQKSVVLERLENTLGCSRKDICSMYPLKSGLTNMSCHLCVDGFEYVYRHPGVGTEKLVDREAEFLALKCAKDSGFDGTFVAGDYCSGWKLSSYVRNARFLDARNDAELTRAMKILRRLHGLETKLPRQFDFFEQGLIYEGMNECKYIDYELKEKIRSLHENIESLSLCMTHNDFWPANILIDEEDKIHVIDWEYAGMGDYANDFGSFVVSSQLNDDEADRALELYFDRRPTVEERIHNYAHVALAGWCWYNWALLKEQEGASVGEWTEIYKSYAENYLNRIEKLQAEA